MKKDAYLEELRKIAEKTEAKLKGLLSERAELDKEIARTKKYLINTLQMIEGKSDPAIAKKLAATISKRGKAGLRDMCLEVLEGAYEPLTATDIVKELTDRGFAIDKYRKPLSVVSTTLKRLVLDKKAELVQKDGKAAYRTPLGQASIWD